jgi:alpha-ketoglutarate-dependent sulfate ester dioxygenase
LSSQPPFRRRTMTDLQTARATKAQVRRLSPRIGAVISEVDLASDLPQETIFQIQAALLAHRVVFFRDQHLSGSDQLRFARRLGPLTKAHPTLPGSEEDPALFDLDSYAGAAANHWHTDVTFVQQPPTYSVLRAIEIPEIGGDTLWANTAAAYGDLRPSIRAMAERLRAIHTNGQDYGRVDVTAGNGNLSRARADHVKSFVSTVYETEHPVVRLHPETDEPTLLLGGFAQKVVGHSTQESTDILRTIQTYVTRPENTVRWHWKVGDVAIWDNRSTQHYAIYDYGKQRRRVERVTTAGVTPVGLDGQESVSVKGDATRYYPGG